MSEFHCKFHNFIVAQKLADKVLGEDYKVIETEDLDAIFKKAIEEVIKTIDLLTGVKITSHYIDNLESVSNAIILTTFDKLDKNLHHCSI